jgi:hypothetical protein
MGDAPTPENLAYLNSHVIFRMARQLLQDGKPLPQGHLLWAAEPSSKEDVILGALAFTERHMLSFWPAFPARLMRPGPTEQCVICHATICLQTGKSHLTAYDATDSDCRPPQLRSRLTGTGVSGYCSWLMCAAKWTVLRAQPSSAEGRCPMPTADSPRRQCEWVRFVNNLGHRTVPLPCAPQASDFVVFEVGLAARPDDMKDVPWPCPDMSDIVDGLVTPGQVELGTAHVDSVLAGFRTWLPTGTLRDEVWLGLRRRLSRGRRPRPASPK